jgi:2-methylisocitrate lyase-like PEP mutase family enzyme
MMPGATDALIAKIIEKVGFDLVYVTGAGFANAQFGLPDIGLITMTEILEHAKRIVQAVNIPVIVDVDTGYGNAINLIRTVKEFESIGVAGIQIEDQITPKKCGHFEGKSVIEKNEMVKKIEAAANYRTDTDFIIIARTDARAVYGIKDAIKRGLAYYKAGADVLFIEAPTDREELIQIAESTEAPLVVNIVEGGKTPCLPCQELEEIGYKIALFANTAMRIYGKAVLDAMTILKRDGSSNELLDKMFSWEERQNLANYDQYQKLEQKYLGI